jgi:hypothetical protein
LKKTAAFFLTVSILLVIVSIDFARQSYLIADGLGVPTILGFWLLGDDLGWTQPQFLAAFYWTARAAVVSVVLFFITSLFDL